MTKNNSTPPDCCKPQETPENRKGILWGIIYGIIPHTFCILFALLSILGATTGSVFFGNLFRTKNILLIMVSISFFFAALTAVIYLKRLRRLNFAGIKEKWGYLSILFATTIAVNFLIVFVVFPNVSRINNHDSAVVADPVNIEENVQIVRMDQLGSGYKPNQFTVKKGIPVKWIINSKSPNSCSASIYMSKMGIGENLNPGENIIEFTPKETGEYRFACAMGMYTGKFVVTN